MTVDKIGVVNDFSAENNGENILILEILIKVTASALLKENIIDEPFANYLILVMK